MRTTLLAAAAALAVSFGAHAASLNPVEDQAIDLGDVAGDAYYTVQPDGFHVVATLAGRHGGTPVRFQAVLSPGQAVTVSTPRAAGVEPVSVKIRREDAQLVVTRDEVTN